MVLFSLTVMLMSEENHALYAPPLIQKTIQSFGVHVSYLSVSVGGIKVFAVLDLFVSTVTSQAIDTFSSMYTCLKEEKPVYLLSVPNWKPKSVMCDLTWTTFCLVLSL